LVIITVAIFRVNVMGGRSYYINLAVSIELEVMP
jgi:hypothetical protein